MKNFSVLAAGLGLCALAIAADADRVSVVDPYVRLAPPNAMATGAFMVIRNAGERDVRVVRASNPASRITELHTHLHENGVMKMRPVPAIDIKAGGEAVLKPGGLHVMLIDLKTPLQEGGRLPITLEFADGSSLRVEAPVVRPTAGGMPMNRP